MLNVTGLNYTVSDRKILSDIKFSLQKEELICLIGPNGAGKSTLLRAICGIIPSGNAISLNGENLNKKSEKQRAKEIALVSSFSPALNGFTMEDLLNFSRYPYMNAYRNLDLEESSLKKKLIEEFEISDFHKRDLTTLSSGEMQKILLACAFFQEPSLLLVDEALSNLDPKVKIKIHRSFKKWINKTKNSLIYITHDINEALQLADRVMVIESGKLKFFDTPMKLLEKKVLDEVYQIEFKYFCEEDGVFVFPKREGQ
jgi:iron complex transport system ATP-binding protein